MRALEWLDYDTIFYLRNSNRNGQILLDLCNLSCDYKCILLHLIYVCFTFSLRNLKAGAATNVQNLDREYVTLIAISFAFVVPVHRPMLHFIWKKLAFILWLIFKLTEKIKISQFKSKHNIIWNLLIYHVISHSWPNDVCSTLTNNVEGLQFMVSLCKTLLVLYLYKQTLKVNLQAKTCFYFKLFQHNITGTQGQYIPKPKVYWCKHIYKQTHPFSFGINSMSYSIDWTQYFYTKIFLVSL